MDGYSTFVGASMASNESGSQPKQGVLGCLVLALIKYINHPILDVVVYHRHCCGLLFCHISPPMLLLKHGCYPPTPA